MGNLEMSSLDQIPRVAMSMKKACCKIICIFVLEDLFCDAALGYYARLCYRGPPNPRNDHYHVDQLRKIAWAPQAPYATSTPWNFLSKKPTPKLPFSPIPLDLNATQSCYAGPYRVSHPYR